MSAETIHLLEQNRFYPKLLTLHNGVWLSCSLQVIISLLILKSLPLKFIYKWNKTKYYFIAFKAKFLRLFHLLQYFLSAALSQECYNRQAPLKLCMETKWYFLNYKLAECQILRNYLEELRERWNTESNQI